MKGMSVEASEKINKETSERRLSPISVMPIIRGGPALVVGDGITTQIRSPKET